jgi:Flp pilus assembly protein TadD
VRNGIDEKYAERGISQLLSKKPDEGNAWLELGLVHLDSGEFASASAAFERALVECNALSPVYARALAGRGAAVERLGKSEAALIAYGQSLTLSSVQLEIQLKVARNLMERGDIVKAMEHFHVAMTHDGHAYDLPKVPRLMTDLDLDSESCCRQN